MIGLPAGARLDAVFSLNRVRSFVRSGMLPIFDSRSARPNKRGNHESMQRRESARRREMRDADVERLRASQQRHADGVESGCKFRQATPADKQPARDVRKALSKAPDFNVSNVFVKARGSVVTLSGSVSDGPQIQQAAEVAKGVPGATTVSNHLTLYTKGY